MVFRSRWSCESSLSLVLPGSGRKQRQQAGGAGAPKNYGFSVLLELRVLADARASGVGWKATARNQEQGLLWLLCLLWLLKLLRLLWLMC